MKFTTAWAEIASQNVTLKASVAVLMMGCLGLAVTTARLALRDPLIIERSCRSEMVQPSLTRRSDTEVKALVELALRQRFDSGPTDSHLLSDKERDSRKSEQKALSEKEMSQKIIVRGITVNKDKVEAETDRLISVGQIRSAFSFPVLVELSSVDRSELNPYGLILSKVEAAKKDEKK